MVHCIIKNCDSNSESKDANITLHRFPSELALRTSWITAIGRRPNWDAKGSRVCSKHFEAHCFLKNDKSILRSGAVPKLFLQDKTTEAKAKREDMSGVCNKNDSPRAQKLKQDILLLRKKSRADGIKIKCLQGKIRRIMRKQEKLNELKAPAKNDRGTNWRWSSFSPDQSSSLESLAPSPNVTSVDKIHLETDEMETITVKHELMDDESMEAGPSAAYTDAIIGGEDLIDEVKIEQEHDPLMFSGFNEMPYPRLLSQTQNMIFLSFMEQHKDLATASHHRSSRPEIREVINRQWDELATLINTAPGKTKRSGGAWRKFWNERKYNLKKKLADILATKKSGKPMRMRLNEEDYRIMRMLNLSGKLEPSDEPSLNDDSALLAHSDPFRDDKMKELSQEAPQIMEMKPEISDYIDQSDNEIEPEAPQIIEMKPEISHYMHQSDNEIESEEPETESAYQTSDGPPQWAIQIEERRAAASERIAASLEKLTAAVVGMHNSLTVLTTDVATIRNVLVSRPP